MTLRLRISLGLGLILLVALGFLGALGGQLLYSVRLQELKGELQELASLVVQEAVLTGGHISEQGQKLLLSKSEVYDARIYAGHSNQAKDLLWASRSRILSPFPLDELSASSPYEQNNWLIHSLWLPLPNLTVQVGLPLSGLDHTLGSFERTIVPLILVISVLASMLIWWFMGRSLAPLERLTRRIENLDSLDPIPSTEQRNEVGQLARALEHSLTELHDTRKAELEFITTASHELRTPITALRAELELVLRDKKHPTDNQKLFQRMFQTTSHLERLTQNLLVLGRVQGLPLHNESIELFELCGNVVDRMQPLAIKKELDLEFSGAPLNVRGDPILLSRVLENLLFNAIRYTETGGIRVDLQTEWLQIEDTGEGFPQDVIDGLTRNPKGDLGIGLRVVREVIHAHGWQLSLTNLSQGSRIRITF